MLPKFEALDAVVFGISPDPVRSHQRFAEKHDLKVTLLSDPDRAVLEAYGVWQKKKMYGKEYMGVVRSTVLIAPDGRVVRCWEKVKVKNHAAEVQDELQRQREVH